MNFAERLLLVLIVLSGSLTLPALLLGFTSAGSALAATFFGLVVTAHILFLWDSRP
jgi:hypothetical protein